MAGEVTKDTDILSMSDDDFAKMSAPPVIEKTPEELAEAARLAEEADALAEQNRLAEEEAAKNKTTEEVEEEKPGEGGEVEEEKKPVEKTPEQLAAEEAAKQKPAPLVDPSKPVQPGAAKTDAEKEKEKPVEGQAEVVNYEEAYKEIMKPFKANGKMIEPRNLKEVVQLMQMGANYTRKLQELQPSKKMLMMLEQNGLLSEDKINFLIDIEKKNPEAIKKLLKDSGVDPLSIDTEAPSDYQAGNHAVSDAAVEFQTILQDLTGSEEGKATIQLANNWDQASKEVLWANPKILSIMHEQRENGFYDLIAGEVERQRVLGAIPATTSFLHAYKQVGDQLAASGKLGAPNQVEQQKPAPVATSVAKPKPVVKNGAAASAAATTRTTPRTAKAVVNPLAMSDDDFLAQMAQRV